MLQRQSFEENDNYHDLIVDVLLTLGLHAVFFELCKIYGTAAKQWNELPLEVRNSSSLNAFKNKLKTYLLNN